MGGRWKKVGEDLLSYMTAIPPVGQYISTRATPPTIRITSPEPRSVLSLLYTLTETSDRKWVRGGPRSLVQPPSSEAILTQGPVNSVKWRGWSLSWEDPYRRDMGRPGAFTIARRAFRAWNNRSREARGGPFSLGKHLESNQKISIELS